MKRILLSLALAAWLLASCSVMEKSDLARARAQWMAANIRHYRYSLTVGCFCGFTQRMPLSIEVQDGRALSMTYNDGSQVPDSDRQFFARYQTIDALFDFTNENLGKADQVQVMYDRTAGFPTSVQIDLMKNAADDELDLTVENFQALP